MRVEGVDEAKQMVDRETLDVIMVEGVDGAGAALTCPQPHICRQILAILFQRFSASLFHRTKVLLKIIQCLLKPVLKRVFRLVAHEFPCF